MNTLCSRAGGGPVETAIEIMSDEALKLFSNNLTILVTCVPLKLSKYLIDITNLGWTLETRYDTCENNER